MSVRLLGGLFSSTDCLKWSFLEPKMQFFRPQIHFFVMPSNFFVTFMTGHQKGKVFVLNLLHGGRWGSIGAAAKAHFWPENIHFFAAHPYNPHFLGLHESDPMES